MSNIWDILIFGLLAIWFIMDRCDLYFYYRNRDQEDYESPTSPYAYIADDLNEIKKQIRYIRDSIA